MSAYDVLIVGAGHAGAQAAVTLRQNGLEGSVALIGDEAFPPYERPPLSKEYFSGDRDFEDILIRPAAFWAQQRIDLLLSRRVSSVDARRKIVAANGEEIGYGKLIWAAGGDPRVLKCPGANARNVYSIRRRDDIDAMMTMMDAVNHVTIVGGGYIGLEAAAALIKFGKRVVLLEAMDRVLARVAGETLSRFYESEHRAHGVDLRTNAKLDCIETHNGKAVAVRMSDSECIQTDLVIVGIGITPAVQPLIEAGAAGHNGVDVDEFCRTSLSDIYAVGDCAAHMNRYAPGARIRLESVQNANDQAKAAAAHLLGSAEPYDALPWFWSHQYDLKLQTIGVSGGHDRAIIRGAPSSRSFSVVYLRNGKVIALDCINAVRDFVQGRARIMADVILDENQLANAHIALKDVQTIQF